MKTPNQELQDEGFDEVLIPEHFDRISQIIQNYAEDYHAQFQPEKDIMKEPMDAPIRLKKMQDEAELFKLEQQLDIPFKDRYYNREQPEKVCKQADWKEFDEAMAIVRESFVGFMNGLEWNIELRTRAESLIIIYDQARERLSKGVNP